MVSLEKLKQLKELKELLDGNIINEKEFIKLKSELLNEEMDSKEEPNIKNVTRNEESKNDDSEKTQNGEEDHIRNYSWSVIPEPIRVEDESEKWKNLKSKIDEPNSNKTKTSSKTVERKTSINNLPLIVFLAVAGIIGFLIYNNTKSNNETETENSQNTRFTYLTQPVDDLESMSVTSISNEQELYAYLDEVATYWCSEWQKAKQYQNENRRFEEMLKVDRCINAYPLGFQEGIIMLNDLPMELNSKAREHFQNKVKELGFNPNWDEETSKEDLGEIESSENNRVIEVNEDEYNRQQEEAERQPKQKTTSSNSIIEKWSKRNLDVSSFNNGDPIPQAITIEEWVEAGTNKQPAWCYYDNDPVQGNKYGKLYNCYAVNDPRGLAPKGWHIPSDAEWKTLTDLLGGALQAGKNIKSTSGWYNNGNGNNESGFSGLPGGFRNFDGTFYQIGSVSYWWSSTRRNKDDAWYRGVTYNSNFVYDDAHTRMNGFYVRCLRD